MGPTSLKCPSQCHQALWQATAFHLPRAGDEGLPSPNDFRKGLPAVQVERKWLVKPQQLGLAARLHPRGLHPYNDVALVS